jgi:hypothetical protein
MDVAECSWVSPIANDLLRVIFENYVTKTAPEMPGAPPAASILCTYSRTPIPHNPYAATPMSVKYYTHFLMQERQPKGLSEFRGVVEVNRTMPRGDLREATQVLARNFECESKDIKILQWSRLH